MKKTVLAIFVSVLSFALAAQGQLENPGFENWEVIGGVEEPEQWSSLQTGIPSNISGLAPMVMEKSTDAHTGNFSVHVKNVSTFGVVATGTATNGRVFLDFDPTKGYVFTDTKDPAWNTPLTDRPDSIAFWYKFDPAQGSSDVGYIKVLIHSDTGRIPDPDSANYIAFLAEPLAEAQTWTRVSFPFTYRNNNTPEYILVILNSGDGTNAVKGSEAWFDDLELIYNSTSVSEIRLNELVNVYGAKSTVVVDMGSIGAGETYEFRIYDLLGREVYAGKAATGGENRVGNMKPGIYVCTLMDHSGRLVTKKVMVP